MTQITAVAGTAYTATYLTQTPYFDHATAVSYAGDATLYIVAWKAFSTVANNSDFLAGSTVPQGKVEVTVNAAVNGGVTWTEDKPSVAEICGASSLVGTAQIASIYSTAAVTEPNNKCLSYEFTVGA